MSSWKRGAGIQSAPQPATPQNHTDTEPTTQNSELIADDCELTTNDSEEYDPEKDPLIIELDEIIANLNLSEREEEPPLQYKPDYSMWDIIQQQPFVPSPDPSIGAAKFRETIERWKRADEAALEAKKPNPKKEDRINYDDG